jgi:hypothetical protein
MEIILPYEAATTGLGELAVEKSSKQCWRLEAGD